MNAEEPGMHTGSTEQVVGAVWRAALRSEVVRRDDDFFELGGDSIMMMMTLFQVGQQLQMEISPALLLENPTLGEFCAAVEAERVTASGCV